MLAELFFLIIFIDLMSFFPFGSKFVFGETTFHFLYETLNETDDSIELP